MANDIAERLNRLTDDQRELLRLVFLRQTTKQISRDLGVPIDTVNARIASAKRKLGTDDRGTAAMWLAEFEGRSPYQRVVYQPEPVAGSSDVEAPSFSTEVEGVAETQAAFHLQRPRSALDRLIPRGDPDDMPALARVVSMVAIALGVIIILLVSLSLMQGLSNIAHKIWPVEHGST